MYGGLSLEARPNWSEIAFRADNAGMGAAGESVSLRTIELRDAEAVAALTVQLGYQRSADAVREWIGGLGSRAGTQTAFVACLDAEVVGWIEVCVERHLQSEPFALIGGLVVSEVARGNGIGRRLCEAVETWAADCGVSAVRVTSRSTREAAHRFYRRDGYADVKTSLVFEKRVSR